MGLIDKTKEVLHLNKKKEGDAPLSPTEGSSTAASTATTQTPAFDSKKVMVIYVLGGPGAGTSPDTIDVFYRLIESLFRRQRHPMRAHRPGLWICPPLRLVLP